MKLETAAVGIDSNNLLTANINLPEASYPAFADRRRFFDALEERCRQIPGVSQAAISLEIPLEGGIAGNVVIDGREDRHLGKVLLGFNYVTPDYFTTFRIPLLRGRGLAVVRQ